MSYILDALKKAEQQRELGQVPGIDSGHEVLRSTSGKYWLWAIAAIVLLNAAILFILFWPSNEDPQVAAVVEAESRLPIVRTPASAPPAAQVAPIPVARPEPEPEPPPVITSRSLKPLKIIPPVTETARVGEAHEAELMEAEESFQPASMPEKENLPLWPQIPERLFRQIPDSLRLDVHVYSDNPEDRFVLMNMQKYYEGEKLQNGLVLDEITPDGVILSLHGERFRVSAQ